MENTELKKALLKTSLGQSLEPVELELLFQHTKIKLFAPGEIILQQGKKNDAIYIIINGKALVTAKILGEGSTYIATVGQGNIIGEISVIEKIPSETSVIASAPTSCLLIMSSYFEMLLTFFPKTKYKITRIIALEICQRLKQLHQKITSFISHTEMASRSFLSEVIKSLHYTTLTSWSEMNLNPDDLRYAEIFSSFDSKDYEELMAGAELFKAPDDCTLVRQGDFDSSCYLLLRGAVQTSIVEHNKAVKLSVIGPLTLFSNNTLIDATMPSLINYVTCERSILLKIPSQHMQQIKTHSSSLWYKIFDLLCKSLVRLERSADRLDIRLKSELYNR